MHEAVKRGGIAYDGEVRIDSSVRLLLAFAFVLQCSMEKRIAAIRGEERRAHTWGR